MSYPRSHRSSGDGWNRDQKDGLLRLNPGFLQNKERRRPLYDPSPVGSGRLRIHFTYFFCNNIFYFSIYLTDTSILVSGVHVAPFRKYSTVMVEKCFLFLRLWFSENSLTWTSSYLIGKDKCVCICMRMYVHARVYLCVCVRVCVCVEGVVALASNCVSYKELGILPPHRIAFGGVFFLSEKARKRLSDNTNRNHVTAGPGFH